MSYATYVFFFSLINPLQGVVWYELASGRLLELNDKVVTTTSMNVCKTKCLTETGFHCRSLELLPTKRQCHLSKWTRLSKPTTLDFAINTALYADLTAATIGWLEMTAGCLIGHETKQVAVVKTVDECKLACEQEPEFFCRSIHFYPSPLRCVLSKEDEHSVPAGDYQEPCAIEGSEMGKRKLDKKQDNLRTSYSSFAGQRPLSAAFANFTVAGKLNCAVLCSRDVRCLGFSFVGTLECRLYQYDRDGPLPKIPDPTAITFIWNP